jgi:hypothetical protein
MAKSILATYGGNDYQARIFWYQACQAMYSDSKIEKVGFEVEDIKYFDDVVTIYRSTILGERNEAITADYWQVKYHVNANGVLTFAQLTDPKFIKSKTSSILQRLRHVQKEFAPGGLGARFYFISPWQIQHSDPLAKLVSQFGGEIRLDLLFSNSKEMTMVREEWKKHLGRLDDLALENVIRPLRIIVFPALQQLRSTLNAFLISAGLLPVDEGTISNPYDELIRKVRATGQSWFSSKDIEEICKREGFWNGRVEKLEPVTRLGIRSFTRWAENMENETQRMVNLVPHFDGRSIRSANLWNEQIYPQIDKFLQDALQNRVVYALRLDCHSSIAFGTGYLLGTKSGFEVAPVQKTTAGEAVWRTKSMLKPVPDLWSFEDYKLKRAGSDVGLVISITHAIGDDVREYVDFSLPSVGRIIVCELLAGAGGKIIEDGEHAYSLAQQLVQWLKQHRDMDEKRSTLHVFSAAPNGFMFLLGQQAKVLGSIQLYEFDFDNPSSNSYQASLKFPKTD